MDMNGSEGKKREAAKALFAPEQYLTTTGDACINLKDVIDYHEDNKKPAYVDKNGVQRYNGALVCVVGGVMDINHEGKKPNGIQQAEISIYQSAIRYCEGKP